MKKTITIDGREVTLVANALTPRLYRHKFGRDMIRDLNQLRRNYAKAVSLPDDATDEQREDAQLEAVDLEIFENAAYIMALQGDPNPVPSDPDEWLSGFETFSIFAVMPHILELWAINQQTTAKPKKMRATVREETGATFMLRCAELGLSREDLADMTMGMVYDMLIERANDHEQYSIRATQEDFDRF